MDDFRRAARKAGMFLGVLLCALVMAAGAAFADEPELAKSKVTLRVHGVFVLRLKNAEGTVKWANTNTKILKVVYHDATRIVVRAKKSGSAKIRCSVNGRKLSCSFKVKAVKGIPPKMTVIEGDRITFRQDKKKKGVWSTSDEAIAKVTGKKKALSKKFRFLDVGTVTITEKIGKKEYSCKVTVLTKQGRRTRTESQAGTGSAPVIPSRVQQLIRNCHEIGAVVEADVAAGVRWEYWNSSSHRSELTFEETRAKKKTWTNCMGGVSFALKLHGLVPHEAVRWYAVGAKKKSPAGIYWLGPNHNQSEADARRYVETIPVFRKVQDAIADGTIRPGDMLTYNSMDHINVYLGNMTSFDTGHAFCTGSGDGARYQRWVGPTPYLGRTCAYIVRLKEVVGAPDTPAGGTTQTQTTPTGGTTQTQTTPAGGTTQTQTTPTGGTTQTQTTPAGGTTQAKTP